jgi:D-alanyl-lipoteichoic acid acyltransferase DltB (MBOAT superfamily)
MQEQPYPRPFLFAELTGILGGGALILTAMLTRRGQMIFLPYGLLIVAVAFYLRSRRVTSFVTRFAAILVAYMVATLIFFYYLVAIANPARLHDPIWNKVWPLAIFFFIGSVISAIVAKVTPVRASSA